MATEQVQLEFQNKLQQMQLMQQASIHKHKTDARMTHRSKKSCVDCRNEEFMKEEKEITSQFDSDPLLKLKSREVDLKAMENQRKQEETTAKQELERAKLLQAQQLNQQKMEQNEELAELRADTSLRSKK